MQRIEKDYFSVCDLNTLAPPALDETASASRIVGIGRSLRITVFFVSHEIFSFRSSG